MSIKRSHSDQENAEPHPVAAKKPRTRSGGARSKALVADTPMELATPAAVSTSKPTTVPNAPKKDATVLKSSATESVDAIARRARIASARTRALEILDSMLADLSKRFLKDISQQLGVWASGTNSQMAESIWESAEKMSGSDLIKAINVVDAVHKECFGVC